MAPDGRLPTDFIATVPSFCFSGSGRLHILVIRCCRAYVEKGIGQENFLDGNANAGVRDEGTAFPLSLVHVDGKEGGDFKSGSFLVKLVAL